MLLCTGKSDQIPKARLNNISHGTLAASKRGQSGLNSNQKCLYLSLSLPLLNWKLKQSFFGFAFLLFDTISIFVSILPNPRSSQFLPIIRNDIINRLSILFPFYLIINELIFSLSLCAKLLQFDLWGKDRWKRENLFEENTTIWCFSPVCHRPTRSICVTNTPWYRDLTHRPRRGRIPRQPRRHLRRRADKRVATYCPVNLSSESIWRSCRCLRTTRDPPAVSIIITIIRHRF